MVETALLLQIFRVLELDDLDLSGKRLTSL